MAFPAGRKHPTTQSQAYVETCIYLLKIFSAHDLIPEGRVLHAHLIQMGILNNELVALKLLLIYWNGRRYVEVD
ncbi:hypothetical protein RJ641_018326 [Dillenia turbinata]|uniref:Uncharacterized protein n=1 Tax=Dillenia turbinata TaxID=194707 RepID=A0AAN8UL84_9MAGN